MGQRATTARIRRRVRLAMAAAMGLGSVVVVGVGGGTAQAATSIVAAYEMNEGSSATVMQDSGPFGINGNIGDEIVTNYRSGGATGYRWLYKGPNAPPAEPERLATVPDDNRLDAQNEDYAIQFRYKTTRNFGNVVQKGQNGSSGGYFKFEQPNGYMTCLFKDANRVQRAVKSPIRTNDGQWHTIRCELSDWGIRLYVDGNQVRSRRTSLGSINNSRPLSIGGKQNCNQSSITCDYFTGEIDYVRIEKGGVSGGGGGGGGGGGTGGGGGGGDTNQPPDAKFNWYCNGNRTCTLRSGISTDPDGQIVSRFWDFADGTTQNGGVVIDHTFPSSGTYRVWLTVTDDDGATDRTSRFVQVP